MKKAAAVTGIIVLSIVLSGCFVYNPTAEFVKQRYTNGISYFNTFYNAQRLFDEAEDEVFTAQKEFREKPGTGRQFAVPSTARSKFTTSIEKNSKVLSFYPDSKWVDDALLMIGKAYFYLDDNVRAERKFLELAVKFPDSDLLDEASLYLGRCLLRQKKIEEGTKCLEELLAKTLSTDDNIAGLAAYELGQYYFLQDNFVQAEQYYSQSLPLLDDDEEQAYVQFQIAQCFDNLAQYEKAETEYAKVNEYSPGYTLHFNAELSKARTLIRQKKFSDAMNMLNAMLDDTKNTEFFGSIHFEIANSLFEQGERQSAIEKYRYIDTAFVRTNESAQSYFILGKIYEEIEGNYDSARVFYGKARSEFPASKITPDAIIKSDIFNKYDNLRKDLIRFDTLLAFTHRKKIVDDSLAAIVVIDTVAHNDSSDVKEEDQKLRKATKPGKKSEAKKDSVPSFDSTKIKAQVARDIAYRQTVDSLQRSIIRTTFEFGGLFFLELQIPDSALAWFSTVVKNYPQSEFAPRALYTIAEIYRTLKEQPKPVRDSIYNIIVAQYPSSPYAQESRKILGVPLVEAEKDTAAELLNRAEEFADANDFAASIKTYKEIVEKHFASPLASKALYAAGWHYENSLLRNDSAIAVYKRLLAQYPATHYASAVRGKINEYDNEQKRIEDEKQKLIEEQKLKEQKEKEEKDAKLKPLPAKTDSLQKQQTVQVDSLKKVQPVQQDSLLNSPRER